MNNVNLLGRIATDLEMKRTQNNKSYVSFSLAVDRFSNGNKTADFIRCTAWGKNAENIMKFFSKGSTIAVNGSIQTGAYTDRNGTKHYTTGVAVSNFYFTATKKEQNAGYATQNNGYYGNNSSADSVRNGYQNNNNHSGNNGYQQNNYGNYSADKYNGYPEYDGYCY